MYLIYKEGIGMMSSIPSSHYILLASYIANYNKSGLKVFENNTNKALFKIHTEYQILVCG